MFAYRFISETSGRKIEWNWHHDLLCDRLMQLAEGVIMRLIVNAPPRSLKSEICSKVYPAWLLARDPTIHVFGISYEETLAVELSRGTREIMQSRAYKAITKTRISPIQSAADAFDTTRGGKRLARSAGGAVTGRGGDYLIFDDLTPPDQAASESGRKRLNARISNTLISRTNSISDCRILLVQQRLHEEDPTGLFLSQGGWEHLVLPAIATTDETFHYRTFLGPQTHHRAIGEALHPERDSLEAYAQRRREMAPMDWEAQYQQNPLPAEGNIAKRHWFPRFLTPPETFEQIIMAVDTALKPDETNDFHAFVTLGRIGDRAYLLDVFRAHLEFKGLRETALARARRFKVDVMIIEDAGLGTALLTELRGQRFRLVEAPARQSKELRFRAATSMMADELIELPEAGDGVEEFVDEICAFPLGRNDDMADAFAHAINWMKENSSVSSIGRYYKERDERERRAREEPTVRIEVPQGTSHVSLLDGVSVSVPEDRVITVSEMNAKPLINMGWKRLSEPHAKARSPRALD
ncbi:MAG: hypothetical protein JOY99_16450 [Sphingomonadaceae bacterium]|nr:hypothetical protein [Sphingomonadaceae bacterium]